MSDPVPTSPATSTARLEQALFEVKKVIVGPGPRHRAADRLPARRRPRPARRASPAWPRRWPPRPSPPWSGGTFTRLQFTPDLLPADIIGTRIYRASTEHFDVELGPIFANFVLADEINRAPAKVQSALLEVMAEHHVSIGGETFDVPQPVPRAGHPEPHRERGRLPAARGPARPLPDEDRHRLPHPGGGGRDRPPHGREPAARADQVLTPRRARRSCRRWPTRSTSTTAWSSTR